MELKTLEEFVDCFKNLTPYVEKAAQLIDYYDGFYNVGSYTFFGMDRIEIDESIKKGKFLMYDPKTETFIDINGNKVDIAGKKIFPRTLYIEVREKIEQMGATGINTSFETEKLESWPLYIKVNRNIEITTLRRIMENPTYYLEKYVTDNKVFIKTMVKSFSDICKIEYSFDPPYNLKLIQLNEVENPHKTIDEIDLDEKMIISSPVNTTKDKYGKREWRVFVIDNEIQSISRRDVTESVVIEDKVLKYVSKKVQENTGKIPVNYVMDIMEYVDEFGSLKLDIVEFNPMMNACAFFDNNIVYGDIIYEHPKAEDLIYDRILNKNLIIGAMLNKKF